VEEPVELDGVSYSADVLSTEDGWFTLGGGGDASRGGSEKSGGIGAAQAPARAAARIAIRVWAFIVIPGSRGGADNVPEE
jgi:hypothetical protein